MPRRRIKFVWGGPEIIKGIWHLRLIGFYNRVEGKHDDGLAINVRGCLAWLLVLSVMLWLAATAALYGVWCHNPYSRLTFADAVFYPLRRREVLDKHGQALLDQGTQALRAQRWNEALACLRQGLALHPGDWQARLRLAQVYVATNQPLLALRLLQEGLTSQVPARVFLAELFRLAGQTGDFDLVIRTAERFLPSLQGDADRGVRRWLLAQEFAARIGAQQFAEALALAQAQETDDVACAQRIQALLELHRTDDALQSLEQWRARPGADPLVVLVHSVRVFRAARQYDNMERALAELRRQTPTDPQPYVYAVVQQALAGRDGPAQAALDDYLFRFGGSPQNLQLVADALAETANVALLEHCAATARDHGYWLRPFQLLLVQTHVKRGEWTEATQTLDALQPPAGSAAASDQAWCDWTRRLLEVVAAPTEAAVLKLVTLLQDRPWPMSVYQTTVTALRHAGRPEATQAILTLARSRFPASAWMKQQEVDLAQETATRPPQVR